MSSSSTILVIDDEPNLRSTLSLIFQRAGYLVTVAANAGEALDCLRSGPFSLVFLDLRLPGVDGMTLLPEIRCLHPAMPVLILTAHDNLESALEAIRHGARDYLLKPVDPILLLTRVEEILAEARQNHRRQEIVNEIQSLLNELNLKEGRPRLLPPPNSTPLPPGDPHRYLQCGPFTLDLHAFHVTIGKQFIPVSPIPFNYLVVLARHSPNLVPFEALVQEAQGNHVSRLEAREIARWRIHQLRKALEPDPRQPRYLITVRGAGYRLLT